MWLCADYLQADGEPITIEHIVIDMIIIIIS